MAESTIAAPAAPAEAATGASAPTDVDAILPWLSRGRLAPWLIGLVASLTLLTGALVGLIVVQASRETLRTEILAGHLASADRAASYTAELVSVTQANLRELAGRDSIVQAVARDQPEAAQSQLAWFLRNQSPAVNGVGITDLVGSSRVNGSPDSQNIGASSADREWFQAVGATRQPYLGLPTISRSSGRPNVPYAVPILDGPGELRGVLISGIRIEALDEALLHFRPESSRNRTV
jgi:hypothetical protein